jgi:hypothetical protein
VGQIRVPLPPAEAFPLFTPRGEQEWAPDWAPVFPAPQLDDHRPGTVFTTDAHGEPTTWVVTGCKPPTLMQYARVSSKRAGTVTVAITARGEYSEVQVVYDLTSLTVAANPELERFAVDYARYLTSWEDQIMMALNRRTPKPSGLPAR